MSLTEGGMDKLEAMNGSTRLRFITHGVNFIRGLFYAIIWCVVMYAIVYFVLINSSYYKP